MNVRSAVVTLALVGLGGCGAAQSGGGNDAAPYASGPIALQYGKGAVIFRNVQIRPR